MGRSAASIVGTGSPTIGYAPPESARWLASKGHTTTVLFVTGNTADAEI
jgi:hypothetical protein